VLHLAIMYEGSTLSDGTYRNALNQAGGYQNQHRVYDREGEACLLCPTREHVGLTPRRSPAIILRIVQAQRATFYCPNCQRKSGR
jgi:formamidopyrimidine-DNA glycosylase